MNLALVAPTPLESKELRSKIDPEPGEELKVIFEGGMFGKSLIFTHCGVGKVNAAHSTTLMLENYDIDLLVLFGIAGAYQGRPGDVAVAESENYGEEGVMTKEGWKPMEFMGFPLLENERMYYNTFPMDWKFTRLAVKASKAAGFNASTGNFVTVSQCSGTRELGDLMTKRFDGICENMEGAAVAHICALYKVPMVEIRGVSNIVEDRDLKKWNIPLAVFNCSRAVIEFILRLE